MVPGLFEPLKFYCIIHNEILSSRQLLLGPEVAARDLDPSHCLLGLVISRIFVISPTTYLLFQSIYGAPICFHTDESNQILSTDAFG